MTNTHSVIIIIAATGKHDHLKVTTHSSPGTDFYYADNAELGCSKDYASREVAIRCMARDHGMVVVSITTVA